MTAKRGRPIGGPVPLSIQNRRAEDAALLYRLYHEEGLTMDEIGWRLGKSRQAISLRMKVCGIPARGTGARKKEVDDATTEE